VAGYIIANCSQNAPVKKFGNRLIIGEGIDNYKLGRFCDMGAAKKVAPKATTPVQ